MNRSAHPRIWGSCPLECAVAHALDAADIRYATENDPANEANMDFFLIEWGIYVEIKSGSTPRIADQMARAKNVIAIQGVKSAELFCTLLGSIKPIEL